MEKIAKYSITQMESLSGISAFTLRYYDKCGFFPHIERDSRRKRFYDDEDLHRLKMIEALRLSGLSIEGIAQFLEDYDGDEDIDVTLKAQAANIDAIKEKLDAAKAFLLAQVEVPDVVEEIVPQPEPAIDEIVEPEPFVSEPIVEEVEPIVEVPAEPAVEDDDDDDDDWPYSGSYVPRHSRF